MSGIPVRTCLHCGKVAKTGSAFTRHINRCPVALGLSNRRKVQGEDEIPEYKDLCDRKRVPDQDEIERYEDDFRDGRLNSNNQAVGLIR